MSQTPRHLLGLRGISATQLHEWLARAAHWENEGDQVHRVLNDRFVVNMFFENSTRTRFSFEVAEKRLGAEVMNFSAGVSSVQKGESIEDTVRTLEAMGVHAGVIRLKQEGVLQALMNKVRVPLVNAGDGCNEHPTQGLLDLYTMKKQFGEIKDLNVTIIGDIKHSRVARSNLWALRELGANVRFCAPFEMRAPELADFADYISMDQALQSDVVMMLRVQLERHDQTNAMFSDTSAYRAAYGLTAERLSVMQSHAICMHPAPINRNVEMDDEVIDAPQSRVFPQMANGVPVRMAVLEWVMKK